MGFISTSRAVLGMLCEYAVLYSHVVVCSVNAVLASALVGNVTLDHHALGRKKQYLKGKRVSRLFQSEPYFYLFLSSFEARKSDVSVQASQSWKSLPTSIINVVFSLLFFFSIVSISFR